MFVQEREDMVGLDAALIMNPKVWEASGHLENFKDPLVECKKCHVRFRSDQIILSSRPNIKIRGAFLIDMLKNPADAIKNYPDEARNTSWTCKECESVNDLLESSPRNFNLLFKTFIGPAEETANIAYFRPETAQAIFVDFKQILETSRQKLPFGVAQIGKAFRNEITPGNFIFRTREFEQMEVEYFIKPPTSDADWQKYFDHWLEEMRRWIKAVGIDENKTHEHDIPADELAHYSKRTVDFEFEYPFGQKELYGLAYRTDFDLKAHGLDYRDPETGETFVPHVIEPSLGVDRTMLAVLLSAYHETEARSGEEDAKHETETVLRLPKALAPVKVAILPLSKKEELAVPAKALAAELRKHFVCQYDETASIGKRYRRQDEIGTIVSVTVDFQTVKDGTVTIRDRDTMRQIRVKTSELRQTIQKILDDSDEFSNLGEMVTK